MDFEISFPCARFSNLIKNCPLSENALKLFVNIKFTKDEGSQLLTCILQSTQCTSAASLVDEEGDDDIDDEDADDDDDRQNSTRYNKTSVYIPTAWHKRYFEKSKTQSRGEFYLKLT